MRQLSHQSGSGKTAQHARQNGPTLLVAEGDVARMDQVTRVLPLS